jgi:dGTPase
MAKFMTIREKYENIEEQILSKRACLSKNAKREILEEKCNIRTEYSRDRDRIIHSKAFRRLKHKTQVFLAPKGDHFRTRLTHTLEVSQIARTIARGLLLNEDLTEAISLGHDLGHTPFGHKGEDILSQICPLGFKHYEQSVRVIKKLENKNLNLTFDVLDGILNHTGKHIASTLEGKIVKFADRIAYLNHDIDDAIRAGVLTIKRLPKKEIDILGKVNSQRIGKLVNDILINSFDKDDIQMSFDIKNAMNGLREFMFETVYLNDTVKAEENKVSYIIEGLYNYYIKHIEKMPNEFIKIANQEGEMRATLDYISGMTDYYAINKYEQLFIPKIN